MVVAPSTCDLSVVIPCYNERPNLDELCRELRGVLDGLRISYEVLFVDDGSEDGTGDYLASVVMVSWTEVAVIRFTRNFGHMAALAAGIRRSSGSMIITMDADLQHPPRLIPEMVARCKAGGVDVVQMVRSGRKADGVVKRLGSHAFYIAARRLTGAPVIAGAADFRLITHTVKQSLDQVRDYSPTYRLLIPWLGFKTATIIYDVDPRFAGDSKYSLWRMASLGVRSVFSFSVAPLRGAVVLGSLAGALGLIGAAYAVVRFLLGGTTPGWASVLFAISFFSGLQLVLLAVVGEYLSSLAAGVRRRPAYVIADEVRTGTSGGFHSPNRDDLGRSSEQIADP